MTPWRAACIQMKSELVAGAAGRDAAWKIIGRNLDHAVELIEGLCADRENAPRLVVLPEFAFQGPPHQLEPAAWIELACCPIPGAITAPLQSLAKRRGIYIGGNQFESVDAWPGRFFNCCFLIDPRGEVILRFRRINTALWPSPHDMMDAYLETHGLEGTFQVAKTELGNIAMVACGEIAVPEVTRVLMMRGAEIVLHPTNEERSAPQEAAKTARAAENMIYLVSANVAGGIGFSRDGSVEGGRSQIIDYYGERIAFESSARETVSVSAAIDVAALRAARHDTGLRNTLLRARFEMYRPFYSEAAFYPPNQFLDAPMRNTEALAGPVERALRNLARNGVVRDAT
jgi:predicted amidohydrolase